MSKKLLGRASSILGIAAEIAFDDEELADINYVEALETVMHIELRALGLTEREIELAAWFDLYPQDCRIEKLIEEFQSDESHWSTVRPFSLQAYRLRLFCLRQFDEIANEITNGEGGEIDEILEPEDWVNMGAMLVWYAYTADLDYVEDINKSGFGSIGGKGRAGKIFSPAKHAIIFAINNGYNSTSEIISYFETEPTMDEIDIEIYYKTGDPDTFSFFNLSTNKMTRPMKSTTLPAAISQVKAYLNNA